MKAGSDSASPRFGWAQARAWLSLPPEELLGQCRQGRFQASGPGGQKRNRVYSAVRVTHEASGLVAEGSARREALRNLSDALHRLRLMLALSAPIEGDVASNLPTGPDEPAFRADAKPAHADFPMFVLRALHALAAQHGRLSAAAETLGCTTSALTRFLRSDKGMWVKAQELRKRVGQPPLK